MNSIATKSRTLDVLERAERDATDLVTTAAEYLCLYFEREGTTSELGMRQLRQAVVNLQVARRSREEWSQATVSMIALESGAKP